MTIPFSFGGMPGAQQPLSAQMLSFGAPSPAVPVMGNPASIAVPAPLSQQPTGIGVGPAVGAAAGVPVGAPGAAGPEGWFGKLGGMEGVGSIFQGLGSLGQIFGALQGVKLAREQLDFSKDSYKKNLANQTQSYNTALEDRTTARASATGASAAEVDGYLKKHSL